MISDGEKKYSDHAVEVALYLDDKPISDRLKDRILDKLLVPYGLSEEKNGLGKSSDVSSHSNETIDLTQSPKSSSSQDHQKGQTDGTTGQQTPINSLDATIKKYGLVGDDIGFKGKKFIENWEGCVSDMKKEGYYYNLKSKHFEKSR
ncbi:MAG: hypothetical protein M1556_01445 [Candidatus Thermoplasmatota archaeon]|jgi:hypothetical protein|nr:hypothetical protein [Candidatus Thermoplasmatota archaeon]MCL6002300.1 hypothetical protein [Candidatus Thermoplasmatota archaeon]